MRFVRVQLDRVVIVGILLLFCTNLLIIKKFNWKLFQQMLLKHLYHKLGIYQQGQNYMETKRRTL